MLKTVFSHLGEYKRAAVITPILIVMEVVMEVLIPIVISYIIDRGVQAGDMRQIVFYGMIMLGMAFLSLFFGVMGARMSSKASTGLAANLRQAVYEKVQTFSFANIDRFSTAGLVTRMTTDVTNVQNAFQMLLRVAVRAPLMMIGSLIMCFSLSRRLSVIFLIALVFLAVVLILIMVRTLPLFNVMFNKYDDLNASIQENVTAIRVVKAFVREEYENEKFEKAAAYIKNISVKAERLLILNMPVMMTSVYFCMIGLSWFGAHLIVLDQFTTGQLTSMFSYVMAILMSLMMLSMIFVMLSMSLVSAKRIAQVLEEEPAITDPAEPLTEVPDGSIVFDHVDFAYTSGDGAEGESGEYVLQDIDLHIESGETIGIVGGTGSGKSSLVSLISRLYDVNEGRVLVGGHDVKEYGLEPLRDSVSVVLQNNVLFSGTILDNLRWGKEDASREECEAVCRIACADDFIEHMPDGYDTWIEQGGTNVSGGQKQRLCIARALLKSPRILILDDSTSAVDTATEKKLRSALEEKIPGMTKIIISQRISSVESCDRVIVLDNGRVNGFDAPAALLENNAIYRDIYETQMKSGGDFDEP